MGPTGGLALQSTAYRPPGPGRPTSPAGVRLPPRTICKNSGTLLNSSGPQLSICQMGTGNAATLGNHEDWISQRVRDAGHTVHSATPTTPLGGLCALSPRRAHAGHEAQVRHPPRHLKPAWFCYHQSVCYSQILNCISTPTSHPPGSQAWTTARGRIPIPSGLCVHHVSTGQSSQSTESNRITLPIVRR